MPVLFSCAPVHIVLLCASSCQEEERAQYAAHLQAYEKEHIGGFRRIYPHEGSDDPYTKFFEQSSSLCSETAASRARIELARIQVWPLLCATLTQSGSCVIICTQRQEIEHKAKEEERVRNKLAGGSTSAVKSEQGGGEGEEEGEGGGKLRGPLSTVRRVPFRSIVQVNRTKPVADLEPNKHPAKPVSSI